MNTLGNLNRTHTQQDQTSGGFKADATRKFFTILADRGMAGALALILFAIFSISFFEQFGFHNDYSAYQWPYPETEFWFQEGRPLGSILQNMQFYFFHHISDFTWGRVLSSLATVVSFLLTGTLFKRIAPLVGWLAFPAAFLIWTLPPAILYVVWLESAALGIIGSAFVTISYLIVENSYHLRNGLSRISLRIVGYFLLYICFFIYQPTVYFFLVFTAWRSLFSRDKQAVWRVAEELIIVAILSSAYFIFIKIGLAPLLHIIFGPTVNPVSEGQYKMSPVLNLSAQINTAMAFLAQSLVLWFGAFSQGSTSIIALIILVGSIFRVFQNRENLKTIALEISRWAGAIMCCLLATAPFILSHFGVFAPTRVLFADQSILVIILLAALGAIFWSVPRINLAATGLLVGIATSLAGFTVYAVTKNASTELKFLRNSLSGMPNAIGPVVVLMPPNGDQTLSNGLSRFMYGDFLLTATSETPIVGIANMILRDNGVGVENTPVVFIPWESNVIVEGDQRDAAASAPLRVIDMALAGYQTAEHENKAHRDQSLFVSVSPSNALGTGSSSVASAFDPQLALAWETKVQLPIDVTVKSQKPCMNVLAYAFRSDIYEPGRMPRSWQILEKSSNDYEFHVIDTVTDTPIWGKGETRSFPLAAKGCVSSLRFHFINLEDSNILRISKIILLSNYSQVLK